MAEEYNLPLGLDIQKVINDAKTVKSILSDLNTQAENVGKKSAQAFEQSATASSNMGKKVAEQAASFGATTRSVENMKDALNDLKQMAFSEKDTNKIRFYNQEIQKLENQIKQTTNAGKAGFDEMGNRIRKASDDGRSLTGRLREIGQAIGVAFGLITVINFGKELFKLGVQAAGIERAFSRLGDSQSLAKLRQETRGFVSDLELEKLTVKANNFNIPVEKLGTFLSFASIRAKETGESVDKLTNNIIDGLGRKSSRIIDNLGISIVDIQKEFKKTGDFTLAVSNLIEREMNSSGVAVDTLADKVNKITTSWQNAKVSVAGFFATLFNPGVADNKTIGDLTAKAQKQFGDLSNASSRALGVLITNQEKLVSELSNKYTKVLNEYDGAFATRSKRVIDDDRKAFGEQLAAAQNVLRNLKDQNIEREKAERLAKNILSVTEMEQKVTDLRGQAKNIIPGIDGGSLEERQKLFDEAEAIQKQIDEITGKAQKDRDKKNDQAEIKRLQRIKELNAERVNLENEYYSAQIEAIENAETKAVAAETVGSQNRIRELENRRLLFPELTKEINRLIEEEQRQSTERVILIIKLAEEEQLKAKRASQKEIARVLKEDTDAQIEAINDRYEVIIENARKNNNLTAQVEVGLTIQRQKEITDVTIKAQDDRLKKQEELALSGIFIRQKRESQTQKAFERENQIDILAIQIEFADKRLALIATDPAKVKEANDLRKAIQDARNELNKLNSQKNVDLLDILGINPEKLRTISDGISVAGQVASDFFQGLVDQAQIRIDAVQVQIDAIDELIAKQEEAVDKEKELLDKGFANNFANAQRTLLAQKAQRDALLKQEEEARKKQQELQRAQIVADSIAQASNLITASTDIFKVFAKIPVIGVPLAIAAIATMFGGFAIAKVNAFNATKLAEGGTIGGKSHSEGGNKYISIDGNGGVDMIEHERGEEVTKKSSAEKHRKLLKAINKDDFSGLSMNDTSIMELLEGTGVLLHQEKLKDAGKSTYVVNQTIVQAPENTLKGMAADMKMLLKILKKRAVIMDMGDYVLEIKDNIITKHNKKAK